MIDALATERHYADHLWPVFDALPDGLRGEWHTERERLDAGPLTLVCSYSDLKRARAHGRHVVLAEHGAGQSYLGSNYGSHIGAPDRQNVAAVLVPGEDAAARHIAAHPEIPAYVVGCPKLDRWHARPRCVRRDPPTVAVSFHWNSPVAPEAHGAFDHFRPGLAELAQHFKVLGHGHPRIIERLAPHYEKRGIEVVRDFDEILERADIYACDNSSTIFEFASLGRPVVVLNAPWYRRDVEHGMRFWEHATVGMQCDRASRLWQCVMAAVVDEDFPDASQRRRAAVDAVYCATDGHATERAVDALTEIQARQPVPA